MRGVEQIPWIYDGGMAVMEALGARRWREWLIDGARGRVLEVSCGTGRNLPRYAPGVDVTGLDPSAEALSKARSRATSAKLLLGSAHALPFLAGTFDTIISSLIFCSIPEPARGLAEIRRVLRTGGELRMLEHVRATSNLGGRLQDFYQPAWTCLMGGCHPNRDTEAAVTRAGFTITERIAEGSMRRLVAR